MRRIAKKLAAMLMIMALFFTLLPSVGSNCSYAATKMKVALVTDLGGVSDHSYNETVYKSCRKYCKSNKISFSYKVPAGDSAEDFTNAVKNAINDGSNVIILVGFIYADSIYELAPQNPDVKFIGIDISRDDITNYGKRKFKASNVYCTTYHAEQAGYMAGYAAVKLGYKKLGFLGGMEIPEVQRYGYGFIQGANAAAKEGKVKGVVVRYAYAGQFFGDKKITKAMSKWYKGGTKVVFSCGGGIYTSVAQAAKNAKGKVIGVDIDQAAMINADYGKGRTLTSATKDLGDTVTYVLGRIKAGKWNKIKGINHKGKGALANSTQWSKGFTKKDYKKLRKQIESGKRKVSANTNRMPASKNIKVIKAKTIAS